MPWSTRIWRAQRVFGLLHPKMQAKVIHGARKMIIMEKHHKNIPIRHAHAMWLEANMRGPQHTFTRENKSVIKRANATLKRINAESAKIARDLQHHLGSSSDVASRTMQFMDICKASLICVPNLET